MEHHLSLNSLYQVNSKINELLVSTLRIGSWSTIHSSIDLYCGVGNIGGYAYKAPKWLAWTWLRPASKTPSKRSNVMTYRWKFINGMPINLKPVTRFLMWLSWIHHAKAPRVSSQNCKSLAQKRSSTYLVIPEHWLQIFEKPSNTAILSTERQHGMFPNPSCRNPD